MPIKKIKICLAASDGGHLTQIQQLAELFERYTYFFVTEKTPVTTSFGITNPVHFLEHINRKKWTFPVLFLYNVWRSYSILKREKPDIVISTGALSALPICLLAKMKGIKLVFIETYSRVESFTLTGKVLYKVSDLFIIQRTSLKKFYPNAVVGGTIF
jgi:beta-1,4-N-acetylglucosaminyltransferase